MITDKDRYETNDANYNPRLERFSWSAILAGVFMTIAIFLSLMTLGLSLGLAVMDFEGGVSLTATTWFSSLWTVLSFLVALGVSTYSTARLTGQSSNISGVLNGLTVWAVASVVIFYCVTQTGGKIIASTSGAVSQQLQNVTDSVQPGSFGNDLLKDVNLTSLEKMYENVDAPELKASIEIELKKLKADATAMAKDVMINPDQAETNFKKIKNSAKASVANLKQDYDQEKLAAIIARNSELTQAEAQKAAQEWHEKLDNMPEEIDQAFTKIESKVVDVSNSAKNSVATTSFLMFLFLCLGFVVSIISSSIASREINFANEKNVN